MVTYEHFWIWMEEFKIASDYMFVVSTRIYEKVICHILMEMEFQKKSLAHFVLSKDTYHPHFDLCIDELEQMMNEFVKKEGTAEVTILNVVISINDVVLFANTLEDAQKIMNLLDNFCIIVN